MNAADLTRLVDTLTERLNNTNKLLDELRAEHKRLQETSAADLRTVEKGLEERIRQLEVENAGLKKDVEELKKGNDRWGARTFTVAMSLVTIIGSSILSYFIKKP